MDSSIRKEKKRKEKKRKEKKRAAMQRTVRPRSVGGTVLASQQKYLLTLFWFSHSHF